MIARGLTGPDTRSGMLYPAPSLDDVERLTVVHELCVSVF